MKIVFLDQHSIGKDEINFCALRKLGTACRFYSETANNQVAERIANADIVIVNKVNLDAHQLQNAKHLKLVCIAATGTNNIDLAAAKKAKVQVCNIRNYATPSVVQHVFGLIFTLASRLQEHYSATRHGDWEKANQFCMLDYPYSELAGKTMGIIGYGTLGRAVAKATGCFDIKTLVANRPGDLKLKKNRVALEDTISDSDIITLHCPLAENTRQLVNRQFLQAMKPSAFLINTARGGLINEGDLAEALKNREIAGAGLDVLIKEPPDSQNILLNSNLKNLLITPHVAWASIESRQRLVDQLVVNINSYISGDLDNRLI